MACDNNGAMRTLPRRHSLLLLVVVSLMCISVSQGLRFLGEAETYAQFPKWNACPNASISFEFKTRQPSALLLYTDDNGRYDYLQLALTKGAVRLWINFVAEENQFVDIEANTEPLNDGRWHRVEIRRNRMETILLVDGSQTSKVSLGSDSDFGRDPAQNNYIYFGGIPTSYSSNLRGLALPSAFFSEKFRGELRNILYFNCSCLPVRAAMVAGRGVSSDPRESCEVRDPCPVDCPCVSVDDGSGCECSYKRECLKDILANYHLPMDEIADQTLVNPSGLDSVVEGGAQLTQGVRGKALLIDGRSQWLRVTGAGHRRECMGDLARCEKGYYLGMWLQFRGAGYQRGVYLSNGGHSADGHGVAFMYSKGRLDVVFKKADGQEWRARSHDVLENRWYHVAATWSQDKGLHLYVNGERAGMGRSPTKRNPANENSAYNGFYVGRANDNTGTERLGQILIDDLMFQSTYKEEKEIRESGPIYRYHLSMDEVKTDRMAGKGVEGRVYGAASEVEGKVGGAILLSGGREYLDLGNVSNSCLSDLDLCEYGLYVSFWAMFNRLDSGRKALVSAPAFNLYQDGALLVVNVKNYRQQWETRYGGLRMGTWYFIELSYRPDDGLSLYVDLERVGHQPVGGYVPPETRSSMNLYVGRDGSGSGNYPALTVDELDVFYADRQTLVDIDFIERGRPTNHHFTMNSIMRGRLDHETMQITLLGRPRVVDGKVGQAVQLDGEDDAIDFGDRSNDCFGNLDLCPHGMLLALWLKPEQLRDKSYYVATGNNGLSISYRDRKLYVAAATTSKTWTVSTEGFAPDRWQFMEVSFHPDTGLRLYEGGRLIAESATSEQRTDPAPPSFDLDRFYLGRGNVDMAGSRNGAGVYDELDVWYADRDYLTSHGYVQRTRPDSVIVHFEESPDQRRVLHPTLDIRLIGQPRLVPGKVGNALELTGRGQYADLGDLSNTCMGNLARCPQGLTLSAWMKFRSFENNMVFLSTGDNGILMYYKDGYIQISANGRGLVSTPRFETERWYHVEVSWHPAYGMRLYINNELAGESPYAYSADLRGGGGKFYVGRPNDGDITGGTYSTGNFDIDELEVWYGRREDLLAFGYIDRDELGYEAFSMDSATGDRIDHTRYVVLLVNGARLVPGRQGQAVALNGLGQYVDLGAHADSCLGNLDQCDHGFTMSVWIKPGQLRDNVHFISAPSYSLFYEDGQLKAEFSTADRVWTVSTPNFRTGEWQRVTLSWQIKKGLTMYINDELMATSAGVERPQGDQPVSDKVYVGRTLADTRLTAEMQADELQVWYDYLDQLRATGQYQVEVSPQKITFDNFNNGYIVLRDRQIRLLGDIQLIQGVSRDSQAVYLDGRNQYLDMGEDFTCNGDLNTCRQGATLRFALYPERLTDGTYFIDSFPVKLYYKDGRLYAEMQTSTRVWTVDTSEFRQGQMSRVELTWHPTQGMFMYVNGRRVDYDTFPRNRTAVVNTDRRTYIGRPLNDADGAYANTVIDNLEFYNAYRTYVPEDTYLSLLGREYVPNIRPAPYRPPTEVIPATRGPGINIHGEPGTVVTQRPPYVPQQRRTTTIIRLDGAAYVRFNFDRLPAEYLSRTTEEEFSFWFLTKDPNGLIWFHEDPRRNLYIAVKDGRVVFYNDNKSGRAPEQVVVGARGNKRYDDFRWHRLMIRRTDRRIRITVDDEDQEEYIFSDDIQFLTRAEVWLGGTPNTYERTRGNINSNFIGGIAEVIYVTTQRDEAANRVYRNEVNLITQLSSGSSTGSINLVTIPYPFGPDPPVEVVPIPPVTPRPPVYPVTTRPTPSPTTVRPTPPPTTVITIRERGVYLQIPGYSMRSGSSISYRFQTIDQDGLMLFAGDPRGEYFAVELVDGRLYFVNNFGRDSHRTSFASRVVSDGQPHEVEMRFYPTHVDLRVDEIRERLDLQSGERQPSNLGSLYVAGYQAPYSRLPWMVWSRESYLGCLEDLRVDGRIVDLSDVVQRLYGKVEQRCLAMPQECLLTRPCQNGECLNSWANYMCDCTRTSYRGDRCQLDAWTALFNGSVWARVEYPQTMSSHTDDISLRFRSFQDGLLFQTFDRTSNVYMKCSLENGRIKVETNLGGELKTLYTGEDLNDFQWHTLYIQRRGNEMEVWVDDGTHTKATLAGQDYFFNVDRIFLGGLDQGMVGYDKGRYIGYLQNFFLGGRDVLEDARGSGLNVNTYVSLPPLIYYPVTFPQFDSHVVLPPLRVPLSMVLHFMFKTTQPDGLLLLSTSSRNQDYLAVELFEGRPYIHFKSGNQRPLEVSAQQTVNDNEWHQVTIRRTTGDQRQFELTVDGVTRSVAYAGQDGLDLQGPLYIGGAPDDIMQRDYIRNGIHSRVGFMGCLASMDLSGQVPDLKKFAADQKVTLLNECQPIIIACVADSTCKNFGECIVTGSGTFTCDCSMSAHSGTTCQQHPIGFRFHNSTRDGFLIYTLPQRQSTTSDEIAFGVMTYQEDAVLLRIFSETVKDFIEFRLKDGYLVADYDLYGDGGVQTLTDYSHKINDGNYHIVRFYRGQNQAELFIDDFPAIMNKHTSAHNNFDLISKMYIGGSSYNYGNGQIGNGFNGILGGLYFNKLLVFPQAEARKNTDYFGDVFVAPRPFTLVKTPTDVVTLPPPIVITTVKPIIVVPVIPGGIPGDVGGGGAGWTGTGAGVVDTVIFPGGDGGSAVLVPGPIVPIPGEAGGLAAFAAVAAPPPLPASGPRAGAVMGTILGIMALASSLMWAFYRCKPGWCSCIKSPPPASMNISAPRATATNKPVLAAVSGGAGAGGAANGAGAGAGGGSIVAGGAGSGGAGGQSSFTNYYMSQMSTANAGGGGAGGGGGEAFDSSTLRATGTFSNKGTSIGTPKPSRAYLGSTASAVSGGGYSGYRESTSHVRSASGSVSDAGAGLTPASIQSYHYEGGGGGSSTADYDLATGVHSGYQSNTLSAGGSMGGGTLGGGGFSSATMSSNYNYSVTKVRTVSGQQQMLGYAGSSQIGVPPGALGEEVRVDCCLMTNDGRSVITGSSLGPPQVWDMQSGELLRIMQGETVGSTNLHLACNDRLLVGAINADLEVNQSSVPKGVHNYMLQIWDFTTGRALEMADIEVCSALSLMSDNDKVVFARSDKFGGGTNVVVWDLLGNQPIKHMRYDAPVGNNDYVHYLALSQNDRYVIAGFTNSFDNFAEFVVYDMTLTSYTITDPAILRLDANPECTAVLPRDEAVTGLRNGDLVIWSLRTGQPSRQLLSGSGRHAHTREVKAVARSEDSKYLVSASADGTLKVWDVETERHINTLNGHNDEVWCCAISPDNEIVVSGSRDKTIRLWRLKSGSEICSFNAGVDIFHVTMSRDKATIVALGDKLGARKLIMLQVVRTKVRRQISS